MKVEDETSLHEKHDTELTQSSTEPTVKAEEPAVGEIAVQSEVLDSFYNPIIMANSSVPRQLNLAFLITHLKFLLKPPSSMTKTLRKRFLACLIYHLQC